MRSLRYFVRRDLDSGHILELSRIVSEPGSLVGESWQAGKWIANDRALRYVRGDADADEVEAADVDAVIHEAERQILRGSS